MLRGLIFGIIGSLIAFVKFQFNLRKCLLKDPFSTVKSFEYKGKTYDYNMFLNIRIEALSNLSKMQIKSIIKEEEKKKAKNKMTEIDEIELVAAQSALKNKTDDLTHESEMVKLPDDAQNKEKMPNHKDDKKEKVEKTTLIVGKNITAGKLSIMPTKSCGGFVNIYPNESDKENFSHKFITSTKKIKVKEGQKVVLINCRVTDD